MKRQVETILPTDWGHYRILAYADSETEPLPHIALIHEEAQLDFTVLVRIHSECMTGDIFHSKRCDCGEQLAKSMSMIQEQKGILIYLRQEGRNIGLINKLKAYQLQDKGMDTYEANVKLGFKYDERKYDIALDILKDIGVNQVRLVTNNPLKIDAFEQSSIKIVERIPLIVKSNIHNKKYLKSKNDLMNHMLKL
ncbi:MAG TPA: GTP cyclohydrolase II [Saprospiraceae bacterium]|nr:GTP cyclohydrolase II [Saprospiraceae bacterium]